MADITEAPTQAEVADSLIADEPQEQVAEQPETEQQFETEAQEQPVEQEQEEQVEETAEDWLPGDQEKVFPDEVLARYATRYGLDEGRISDPLIRQLLVDKINADVFIRQQQEASEQQQFEEEPEAQQEPTQQQPAVSREQYFSNLDRVIAERTDPQVAKEFHDGFMRVFGVPEAEIAKVPPQQAQAFTAHMSKYALNLVQTFIPDILQAQIGQQINQAFPGFGEMHERSAYAMAWDGVRNSNPQFAALPAYGTKEFSRTLREAEAKFPELISAFHDQAGKVPVAQAGRAYALLAKIATGQNMDQNLLRQAAASGARNARRADVRRSAANLGSGQSKAASGQQRASSQFQTNDDIFDDDTMALYQREHGRL